MLDCSAMDLYSPGPDQDMQLLHLWVRLCESGDILAYDEELQILTIFLRRMQAPTTLLMHRTDELVDFAIWAEPQPIGVGLVSMWVHESIRVTIGGLRLVHQGISLIFNEHPTIMVYAGQAKNTELYEGFGFTRHAPNLALKDREVAVLSLTRTAYVEKHQRQLRSA